MATQDIVPGKRFRLYRESDETPGEFEFLCMGTTVGFSRKRDFEDATFPDCDDPDAEEERKSTPRGRSWDFKFSGKVDAVRLAKIEADYDSGGTRKYQLLMDLAAAKGGRTYTGEAWVETLDVNKADNGWVSFDASLRGDGALVTAAVA